LEVEIFRKFNEKEKKVWYEWRINKPVMTHLHNEGGRSCSIGM
jgi:hypothetical protein